MGANIFYRHKQQRKDYADIQSAARKRSLWGSVGGMLGSALLLGLTGGAAAPLITGLMAGGGSAIGGHIGNWLAGKSKWGGSGKLTKEQSGRRWYGSEAGALSTDIKDQLNVTALQTGGKAALFAAGGSLSPKAGGGATTTGVGTVPVKGSRTLGRFFKAGDTGTQTGFGKLIDYRGSAIGKGIAKGQAALLANQRQKLQYGDALTSTSGDMFNLVGTDKAPSGFGSEVPSLESLYADTAGMDQPYNIATDELSRAGKTTTGIFDVDLEDASGDWSLPGVESTKSVHQLSKEKYDLAKRQTTALEGFLDKNPQYRDITTTEGQALFGEGAGIAGMGDDISTTRDVMFGTAETPLTSSQGQLSNAMRDAQLREQFELQRSARLAGESLRDVSGDPALTGGTRGLGPRTPQIPNMSQQATSYGGGTDFTKTSAWEGVGGGTFGLPSTTRGYDYQSVAGERQRGLLDSLRYQNLFGR